MERRAKLIIIGLAAIAVIALFISFGTHSAKQAVMRDKNVLNKENQGLQAKIEKSRREVQRLEKMISSLNQDLDKIYRDKQEVQKRLRK